MLQFMGTRWKICGLEEEIKFFKEGNDEEIIKQQSKFYFNGIHKSYTKYDSYKFKQNEALMDKPNYLGFAILELSKLLTYETYYDKLQPYFGGKNIQGHYIDTDAFVLNLDTKDFFKNLQSFNKIFDFTNINKDLALFSYNNKRVIGKNKILKTLSEMILFVYEVKLIHLNVEVIVKIN